MTIEEKRLLYMRDPLFAQQLRMILLKYGMGEGRDGMDVRIWEESENVCQSIARSGRFGAQAATVMFTSLYNREQTEVNRQFATLVMAMTFLRILNAEPQDAEKHDDILSAIMDIAHEDAENFILFLTRVVFNGNDHNGNPVTYEHYDPIARAAQTERTKQEQVAGIQAESIIGITEPWRTLLGDIWWNVWKNLWKRICQDTEISKELAIKRPKSASNQTGINMFIVAGVCGIVKTEFNKRHRASEQLTDLALSNAMREAAKSLNKYMSKCDTRDEYGYYKKRIVAWLSECLQATQGATA